MQASATVALRRSLVHAPLHSTSAFKPQNRRSTFETMPYITPAQRRGSARHHQTRHGHKLSTVESEPLSAGTVGSAMAADVAEAFEDHPVALSAALPVHGDAQAPSAATSSTATRTASFSASGASPFTVFRSHPSEHGSFGQPPPAATAQRAAPQGHTGHDCWPEVGRSLLSSGMRSHSVMEPGATATVHHASPLRHSNAGMPPPPPRHPSHTPAHDQELDDASAQMPEATRAVMSRLMRQRRAAEERWRSGHSQRWGTPQSGGSVADAGVLAAHARSATWGGQEAAAVPGLPHPLPPGPVPLISSLPPQQDDEPAMPTAEDSPAARSHDAPALPPPRRSATPAPAVVPPLARLPQRHIAVERSAAPSTSSGQQTCGSSGDSSPDEACSRPAASSRALAPSLAQSMLPPPHAAALPSALAHTGSAAQATAGVAPESLAERLRLLAVSQQEARPKAAPGAAHWRLPSAPEALRAWPENMPNDTASERPSSHREIGTSVSQGNVGMSGTALIP